jgi:hypothetical protein
VTTAHAGASLVFRANAGLNVITERGRHLNQGTRTATGIEGVAVLALARSPNWSFDRTSHLWRAAPQWSRWRDNNRPGDVIRLRNLGIDGWRRFDECFGFQAGVGVQSGFDSRLPASSLVRTTLKPLLKGTAPGDV